MVNWRTLVVLGIVLLSGCVSPRPKGEPEIGVPPRIDLEVTVVSLSKDTGTVRIDKIISIDNPQNWTMIGIEEGNEIGIEFYYSARPAKIRRIPAKPGSGSPETPVSHVPTPAKLIQEEGYFVYVIESTFVDEETETILPGLEAGSRFRATVGYSSSEMVSVGEYEIII